MKARKKEKYSLRMRMMIMNLAIAFTSLIVCGILFMVSVRLLVGRYVNNNLDFVLTEVSDNLNEKITFMEEIIYRIRGTDEIMSHLSSSGSESRFSEAEMEKMIRSAIDISNDKNLKGWNEPVVESVCVVDREGNYYPDFYYALIYSDIENRNNIFARINQEFENRKKKSQEHSYYSVEEDTLFFVYTIYDVNMKDSGTVIFEINMDALTQAMEAVMEYEDAFWALTDGDEIIQNEGNPESDFIKKMGPEPYNKAYNRDYKGLEYRIYQRELGMGLKMMVGIPVNQMSLILYDWLKWYILGIVGVILISITGFVFFTYKITYPMKEFSAKFEEVRKGNYEVKLPGYDSREFDEVSITFNEMTQNINYLINQVYEKQLSIKEMELKFLQTQMNPHFMFNVLNSISFQAKMDGNEEVFKMLSSFTQLIRAKIYRDENEKVKISQELQYVDYYLCLQKFRFGDRLGYEIEVEDERYLNYYVPKLCIQLLVENAVVHGIEPKMDRGMLQIHIYKKNESLYIDIKDDGVGFEKEGRIELPLKMKGESSMHNHIGINNAHHIIQLMYGETYGLTVFSGKGKGTEVTIHIPFDDGTERI
ncbi:MAG: sensor histidine kinase [Lachnospiraceae bacterium]|nr:sensor histidine kinase [Lachnospiraceae bacterium]